MYQKHSQQMMDQMKIMTDAQKKKYIAKEKQFGKTMLLITALSLAAYSPCIISTALVIYNNNLLLSCV